MKIEVRLKNGINICYKNAKITGTELLDNKEYLLLNGYMKGEFVFDRLSINKDSPDRIKKIKILYD